MCEGMLWFDNSIERDLTTKVVRAATYYETKYGKRPTLCFVHPTMLIDGAALVDGITIRATNSVLSNHFWLGMADNSKVKRA